MQLLLERHSCNEKPNISCNSVHDITESSQNLSNVREHNFSRHVWMCHWHGLQQEQLSLGFILKKWWYEIPMRTTEQKSNISCQILQTIGRWRHSTKKNFNTYCQLSILVFTGYYVTDRTLVQIFCQKTVYIPLHEPLTFIGKMGRHNPITWTRRKMLSHMVEAHAFNKGA